MLLGSLPLGAAQWIEMITIGADQELVKSPSELCVFAEERKQKTKRIIL